MKTRRAGGERSGSFQTVLTLMAIPLVGLAIFFGWQWLNDGITPKEAALETKQAVEGSAVAVKPPPPVPLQRTPSEHSKLERPAPARKATIPRRELPAPEYGSGGNIVLIIDDLGFEGQPLDDLMALDPNVNCAILPNGTRAAEFATRLNAGGFEVLCHLPMQPRGRQRPGRNAILTSMSDEEIAQMTRENIEAVPYARGVNNHMGSLATSDRRVMESVLRAMPEGMYFIDSRTSGRSVAGEIARELDIRTATRHVFLDDLVTETAVRRQLAELAAAASKHGTAIGIGHPHAVTMRVLADEIPELRARGFRFVRASEVVR
jgi:polysaccharide deacetylase 2 family uncharacterized protein YibQ